MLNKIQIAVLAAIGVLLVLILGGVLFKNVLGSGQQEASAEGSTSIFEEVSNLEALNLGIIDGDDLRQDHGVSSEEGSSVFVEKKRVEVAISLRSIQDDIKIKIQNSETGKLIANVEFTVTVKGKDKTLTYSDTDKDGIIYIPFVSAGDYTVFLSDASTTDSEYFCDKSQIITVSDSIEYTKVDIKDEIKTESQINVDEEDTKVRDADETTDISASNEGRKTGDSGNAGGDSASAEASGPMDDDISEDAEDILAQIESETAEAEASKAAIAGASSGTITAPSQPTIADDPSYIEAHSGAKGIDVSKHNGNIDWCAVKNSGINYAIIRCGYRGSSSGALVIDPLYYQNINAAQANGVNTGVYFFSQAVNEAEAVEEASMVLELIGGFSLQMPVYLDVEKSNGRGDAISVEERTAICNAFLSTIRNAGYTAGIYSNKIWFEGRINTAAFTDYKIWLAQYVDIPTYTATRYDMWQYTSKGSVPGINGNVDMNVLK